MAICLVTQFSTRSSYSCYKPLLYHFLTLSCFFLSNLLINIKRYQSKVIWIHIRCFDVCWSVPSVDIVWYWNGCTVLAGDWYPTWKEYFEPWALQLISILLLFDFYLAWLRYTYRIVKCCNFFIIICLF